MSMAICEAASGVFCLFFIPSVFWMFCFICTCTIQYSCLIFLQDERLVRSSTSPESRIEDSGSEASTDDVNMDAKGNGFHDAENDVDQELDDDNGAERILSGKLSESSGYAGSDLYDYKVLSCSLPKSLKAVVICVVIL